MRKLFVTLTILCISGNVLSAPSLVVSSTTETPKESQKDSGEANGTTILEIYEMDITSNVSNRFAKTLVASKVRNNGADANEATFTVVLPENAFISEFVMEIGGKSYKAYVKGKEEAKNIYDKAVAGGQTAAHVSARDSNRFTVSLNVEPQSKAVFLLTYEELLQRRNEQYELVLNINPGQIVENLNAKININESRPLKFVRTPSLRSGNEISKNDEKLDPSADIKVINSTSAVVKFNPDVQQQKQFALSLGNKELDGLSGQFVVQYDVERDPYGGEVLLRDGYFIHFFAPASLKPLQKHVLFVLDTSGSMSGREIIQLKDAMKSIMNEIRIGDKVSIIEFNSIVKVWDITFGNTTDIQDFDYQDPYPDISQRNVPLPTIFDEDLLKKSTKVIDALKAGGGTNIIGGLEIALYIVKADEERNANEHDKKHQPIIIFLTDGYPNGGWSSTEHIVNKVTELNSKINIPVFSLSFGDGASKDFLRKLSLKNGGFSRHIYEASDASLQLQDFYKHISSPLLSGINFEYESAVKDVTKKSFPIHFHGSELVVTGRYDGSDFPAFVKCEGPTGSLILRPTIESPVTPLERLWAYLTVKQLLEERNSAENKTELTKKAVDLAIRYSFVTDVTSLVVVKPNDTSAVDTENASKRYRPPIIPGTAGLPRIHSSGIFSSPFLRTGSGAPDINSLSFSGNIGYRSSYIHSGNSYRLGFGGGSYWSRPKPTHHGAPKPSTLAPPPQLPTLQNDLPWLASALNPNGTITVAQSAYKLGENYNSTAKYECPKTPISSTEPGQCILLKDCPTVYPILRDLQTYQTYFCSVDNEYAGICCPKK